MADNVVTVTLVADTANLIEGFANAQKAFKTIQDQVSQLTAEMHKAAQSLGDMEEAREKAENAAKAQQAKGKGDEDKKKIEAREDRTLKADIAHAEATLKTGQETLGNAEQIETKAIKGVFDNKGARADEGDQPDVVKRAAEETRAVEDHFAEERQKALAKAIEDDIAAEDARLKSGLAHDEERVKGREISAEDVKQIEIGLQTDVLGSEKQLYDQLLSLYAADTEAYQVAANKKREMEGRLAAEKQAINDRATQREVAAWDAALKPIETASNTLIKGLLSGRQRFQQAAVASLKELVQHEAEADASILLHRLAGQKAADATEQGSILANLSRFLFGEKAKTAAATEGATVRSAKSALERGQSIASEDAEVAAVVTGESVKTAAKGAAAAEGKVESAALGATTVQSDAAKAAAGAYSAIAGIPYVGPALAPAAATVAYGAVMAYESIASAAGGMETVPGDQLIFAHRSESVIPAQFAGGLRNLINSFAGGPAPAFAGAAGATINQSPVVNITAVAQSPQAIAQAVATALRNANTTLMDALKKST